jgi:hypothetical protein
MPLSSLSHHPRPLQWRPWCHHHRNRNRNDDMLKENLPQLVMYMSFSCGCLVLLELRVVRLIQAGHMFLAGLRK